MPSGIPVDHTGKRFGRLLVIKRAEDAYYGKARKKFYVCRCDCGVERVVTAQCLVSGDTQSCGCLQKERTTAHSTTHGGMYSYTYLSWRSMKDRLTNEKHNGFKHYGGRGISMDPRWLDFSVFLTDMGERPFGHTLDRIDVNGDYTPENCRWSTAKEQARNKRTTLRITWQGYTLCLSDWSKILRVSQKCVKSACSKTEDRLHLNLDELKSSRFSDATNVEDITHRIQHYASVHKIRLD